MRNRDLYETLREMTYEWREELSTLRKIIYEWSTEFSISNELILAVRTTGEGNI